MAQTALGELYRIGDLIDTELPNYGSRRTCYLTTGQGAILKGQTLYAPNLLPVGAGNVPEDTTNGNLVALGTNEVQTVSIGSISTTGLFILRATKYDGVEVATAQLKGTDLAATVQAALNNVLGTSAVAVGTVTAGSASVAMAFTVTFSGTNYTGRQQPLIRVDLVSAVADTVGDQTDVTAWSSVTRTTPCVGNVIALDDVTSTASAAGVKVLCVVRQAAVKPGYLVRNNSSTALTAGDKSFLESMSNIVVLAGPTYNGSADANLTETVTSPTGLAGL